MKRSPAQVYQQKDVKELEGELYLLKVRYNKLLSMTTTVTGKLKIPKAQEYMMHGVSRRLGIIKRSVENIYFIFPFKRDAFLSHDELYDIGINLHAFFINIYGLLDNLAWVLVLENNKTNEIKRQHINLFNNDIKALAPKAFRDYLNLGHIQNWYNGTVPSSRFIESSPNGEAILNNLLSRGILVKDFLKNIYFKHTSEDAIVRPAEMSEDCYEGIWDILKQPHNGYLINYRDSLAHRIPPYIPRETLVPEQEMQRLSIQKVIDEQMRLQNHVAVDKLREELDDIGDPCPCFLHSVEESIPVCLHPQILTDFKTVEEIIEKFCTAYDCSYKGGVE